MSELLPFNAGGQQFQKSFEIFSVEFLGRRELPEQRAEMAAEFELSRVNKNSAQFDVAKLEAINGDKIRALDPADFAARITPSLQRARLVADPVTEPEARLIAAGAPLIQERISRLTEAVGMLSFLLTDGAGFRVDPDDAARVLTPDAAVCAEAWAATAAVRATMAELCAALCAAAWAARPAARARADALAESILAVFVLVKNTICPLGLLSVRQDSLRSPAQPSRSGAR